MLRRIALILAVLLVTSTTVYGAQIKNGVSGNEKVVFSASKIYNETEILERIEKGLTDDPKMLANCKLSSDTITDSLGNEYSLNVVSVDATAQKTKVVQNSVGLTSEYNANIIATVSMIPMSGGGNESWEYDGSGYNAKIYVNVTYDVAEIELTESYKILSFKGKLERVDSSISLKKMELYQNCVGWSYSTTSPSSYIDRYPFSSQFNKDYPTNNTYYSHTSLSPRYWSLVSAVSYTSCSTWGYFQRAGSSWSASVEWIREGSDS